MLALAACTNAHVMQGRIDGLQQIAEQAEQNGAYVCAPQELALAQAELDFAQTELDQGDQERASEHLILAEANAQAALRMSPREKCDARAMVVSPPKAGDRDGDGISDGQDACPTEPEDFDGVEDHDGCPDDQDSDADGVPDSRDLCVAAPEDTDGYLDTDGCPDPDNDADGVADPDDRCVDEPEDPDGFEDEDGCPDADNDGDGLTDVTDACPDEAGPESEKGCPRQYKDVVVTGAKVVIKQQVHFESGKSKIRSTSFGLLDTVAQVLRDFPNIRVEVQGHTDDRGNDKYNMKLSQSRSEAVREYLIGQGIEPHRMTARGYGETEPIESNKKASGRAANRRVEFVRTDDAAVGRGQTGSAAPAPTQPTQP
jgi:outer membrane protein OmpA-like peptidoglycan-associated protein